MLSFFPIDGSNNNPREFTITEKQDIIVQLYYNNGANPGSGAIQNPTAKLEVIQETPTKVRIKGILSGSNVTALNSSEDGGDLVVNVVEGSKLDIVANQTFNWPDRIERRAEEDTTGRPGNDLIPDNTSGSNTTNPLFAVFPGKPNQDGVNFKPSGLEAGYLGYGYILTKITVDPTARQFPPALTGQEITVERGKEAKFDIKCGTDPDNNLPISYDTSKVPNGTPASCTAQTVDQGGQKCIQITCQTGANTPQKFDFDVTPKDSTNLVGTPGKFIVNVVDPSPGLGITKSCVKKGTNTTCKDAGLKVGDEVSYKIEVKNGSNTAAKNVVVEDKIDPQLEAITNIQPAPASAYTPGSNIIWRVADMPAGQTQNFTFDAKIKAGTLNTATIINIATAAADGIPSKEARVDFSLSGAPNLETSTKNCIALKNNKPCKDAELMPGDKIRYLLSVANTGQGIAQNVVLTDDYDQEKLNQISNINPQGENKDGKIIWRLGNIAPGQKLEGSFEATISNNAKNGEIIINIATLTGDNITTKEMRYDFPIKIAITETPRTGGVVTIAWIASSAIVATIFYIQLKNRKNLGLKKKK
jgi:uncharacterized repeat protein (TIGR01451 family)